MQAADFAQARIATLAGTLPPNARQLVLAGAGDGALARHYQAIYPSSALLVVEGEPAAAQRATAVAARVIQARLDGVGPDFYRHLQWADCWLFDGTLEQLAAPAQVLASIRQAMQFDACIVACVENPAFAAVPPRHQWDVAALQALFTGAGLRVVSAIGLCPGVPAPGQTLPPTHFLLKAMPA
ncbi:hypothetical protein ABT364_20995 [Massilia sp. SR12]